VSAGLPINVNANLTPLGEWGNSDKGSRVKKFLVVAAAVFLGSTAIASAADAAVWETIASGEARGNIATGVVIGHVAAGETYGLRVKTRAPRGRVVVDAYVVCKGGGVTRDATKRWSYWSSGRFELNKRNLPVPVYGGKCGVAYGAHAMRGGYLTTYLQRYA
jgi:hypothetical protein